MVDTNKKASHREKINYEKKLVARCLRGRRDAWDEFVEKYKNLVYSSILKTFQLINYRVTEGDTDDLFQDIFILLIKNNFRKLRSFKWKNGCSLATWLQVVSKNRTYDYVRRKLSHQEILSSFMTEDATDEFIFQDDSSWADSMLADIDRKKRFELFKNAMRELSKQDRLLVELIYFKEFSHKRASAILGKSIDALYMQKKRVIERLKKTVGRYIKSKGKRKEI